MSTLLKTRKGRATFSLADSNHCKSSQRDTEDQLSIEPNRSSAQASQRYGEDHSPIESVHTTAQAVIVELPTSCALKRCGDQITNAEAASTTPETKWPMNHFQPPVKHYHNNMSN